MGGSAPTRKLIPLRVFLRMTRAWYAEGTLWGFYFFRSSQGSWVKGLTLKGDADGEWTEDVPG